eukprot:TRINITY_DN24057_c0_g1_i2.p1 TRINITY_DN24057_c0_g1~~TRINITY_DN24057_c0_g1_i2.p1  ORF type:complete len:209 (+),score=47.88 TRINITY_DN24057_c0_g1_i2:113-739(+)
MIRRPPRSTLSSSSAASDVYKRQVICCTPVTSGDDTTTTLSPDQRLSDAMYYRGGGEKGAAPKSLLPVREYDLSKFYKHYPLGYSPVLGVNGPCMRLVASNVFATDVSERTPPTAEVLGSLDQTPFQVLLRRVALFTVDPATTVPAPDGGLIFTNHVNAVVTARREAALKAEELKAIKKAKAARNEMLVVGSIVVVFLAWVSRKMGIV